jgi:hypothetical protein
VRLPARWRWRWPLAPGPSGQDAGERGPEETSVPTKFLKPLPQPSEQCPCKRIVFVGEHEHANPPQVVGLHRSNL